MDQEQQLAAFVAALNGGLRLDAAATEALVSSFGVFFGMLYRQNLLNAIDAELEAAAREPTYEEECCSSGRFSGDDGSNEPPPPE